MTDRTRRMGPSERMRVARKAIERHRKMHPAATDRQLEGVGRKAVRRAAARRSRGVRYG